MACSRVTFTFTFTFHSTSVKSRTDMCNKHCAILWRKRRHVQILQRCYVICRCAGRGGTSFRSSLRDGRRFSHLLCGTPSLYLNVYRGYFLGTKGAERETDTSHLVPWLRLSGVTPLRHLHASTTCTGQLYLYLCDRMLTPDSNFHNRILLYMKTSEALRRYKKKIHCQKQT